jgi:DNA repair protein SbcC/Rad50
MRIERIKSRRLTGLGDVDWTFPVGPVLLFCKDRSLLRILGKLLIELFYDLKTLPTLKTESSKGLLEVWLAGENARFHIRQDFIQQGHEFGRASTLVTEEGTGKNLSLPETLTLGDYLFQVNLRAFQQGVVVDWPEKNEREHLSLLINNLRQGGDEGLSLNKVRTSLAGAQKRVSEQRESMVSVKAEYEALRREWEAAHRQLEEERLHQIEIRKLQENEGILSERIASAIILQERLALLTQNPDYRELCQLQGELTKLEEQLQAIESKLTTLNSESEVDWAVIENLREECLEWASHQKHVEHLDVEAKMRAEKIAELKDSLQTSGYEGLPKDEDQRLRRAEEERDTVQEELNKLTSIKNDLESTQLIYSEEIARLQDFADMAGVTEADEAKLAQRERRLKQWQSSKIGGAFDRTLGKHLSWTSIGEKLASRLDQYYEGYHASNFEEFTIRLKNFRDQQKLVEKVRIQIERLQEQAGREDILLRAVQIRTELLKQAFLAAKAEDFSAWLNGWEDYQRKKHQLTIEINELQLLREQSPMEEKKLQACAGQLREKLGAWDTPTTDRDEVLAAVFKVASQLQAKDETEREIAAYAQRFKDLLGDRNMESLTAKLEPLADLERETRVSDDQRLAELTTWQKERLETRKQCTEAEEHLQYRREFPSLTVLEKKIETVKRRWVAYENLHSALDDAQVLLETSWQEWQAKYGKALDNEMKWILSKISPPLTQEMIQRDLVEAMRDYFAYRMAIAQLSLGSYTKAPLFFSVGDIDEGERFWLDVIEYFRKLSLTRQIILMTTDPKVGEEFTGAGWSSLS